MSRFWGQGGSDSEEEVSEVEDEFENEAGETAVTTDG
ncbi:unnamed protein product [Rhodiola kirilowii]